MLKLFTATLLATTLCNAQTASVSTLAQMTAPGPIPAIQHENLPVVGTTFTYLVPATSTFFCGIANLDATYALIVGRSNPSLATPIGTLMSSADVVLMLMPNPGGMVDVQQRVRFRSPIPSDSTLMGVDLYMQMARYFPCPGEVQIALGDCMKVTVGS